jgi:hypothetical protein
MLQVRRAGDGGTSTTGGEERKFGRRRIAIYWIREERKEKSGKWMTVIPLGLLGN